MHNASVLACVLEAWVGVYVRVIKGARARVQIAALRSWRVARWKKDVKKREAIICYAGLTLKQGINGKL